MFVLHTNPTAEELLKSDSICIFTDKHNATLGVPLFITFLHKRYMY